MQLAAEEQALLRGDWVRVDPARKLIEVLQRNS